MCQDLRGSTSSTRTSIFRTGNNTARRSTRNPHSNSIFSQHWQETIETVVQERERERESERKRGDESHLKIGNLTLVQDMFFQFAFDSTLISRIVWNTNLKLHLRRDASSENALSLNMSQNHLCKFMWWSVVKYFGATHDFKLYIWSYGVGLTQGMHSSFKFEDVWTKIAVFAFWSYHDQKQICIFVAFDFCGEVCWA